MLGDKWMKGQQKNTGQLEAIGWGDWYLNSLVLSLSKISLILEHSSSSMSYFQILYDFISIFVYLYITAYIKAFMKLDR